MPKKDASRLSASDKESSKKDAEFHSEADKDHAEAVGGVADPAEHDAEEIKAEFTEHKLGEVPVEDSGQVTRPTTVEEQEEAGEEGVEVPLVDPAGDLTPREAYKDPEFNPVAAAEPPGHRGGPGAPDDLGTERAEPSADMKEKLDGGMEDDGAENLDYDWKGTDGPDHESE